jgi:small subunit ribosomal protein S1
MPEPLESFEELLAQADSTPAPRRGDLLRGFVISSDPQGLIIDLGLKRDGVVPRGDLEKLPEGEKAPSIGDEVAVMIVDPVDSDGNLVVSFAQARESGDWLEAQRMLDGDAIIEAVPCGYNRGGLIVSFGRLRGFVPASHLTDLPRGLDEDARASFLKQMIGRKMPFKVIEVDPQRQRLVLSERKAIRQWRQDQKGRVISELKEGETRRGVVTSLREFGAFVDIGGADGLIHISELSWRRVEDPGQVLQIGQQVEAMVIRLDKQANRIGLSLKRLQPSPWQAASERLQPGVKVEGVVTRISNSGAYVQLEDGVEGLVRTTEGVGGLVPGTRVEAQVVSLDPDRERLELALLSVTPSPMADAEREEPLTEGR